MWQKIAIISSNLCQYIISAQLEAWSSWIILQCVDIKKTIAIYLQLFDYIAVCLKSFLKEEKFANKILPLGKRCNK